MKNKKNGGMCCQISLISKKGPNAKMPKELSNIDLFSSIVSLTRHFTKFTLLEQLTAMPQFNMQNMFFGVFFLSNHHDTNPLLHLYHFCKKYNYILANINNESSRVMFSFFFCLHPVGQTFLYPSKFCNHLKHSA